MNSRHPRGARLVKVVLTQAEVDVVMAAVIAYENALRPGQKRALLRLSSAWDSLRRASDEAWRDE